MSNFKQKLFLSPKILFKLKSYPLKVIIETPRLFISSYDEKDFQDCVLLYGDSTITKFFDDGKPRTKKEVQTLIRQKGKKYFNKGLPFGLFSVFEKKSGNFVGQVDLIPTNTKDEVEIGCIFHRLYHNSGYCPEIIKVFLNQYVEEINYKFHETKKVQVNRVIATTHPRNFASIRMIKYVGMKYEKILKRFGSTRLLYSFAINSIERQRIGA